MDRADQIKDDIDSWETLMFLYKSALKEVKTKVEILNDEFVHVHNYNPIEYIKSRIKTPESIVKKLKRKGRKLTFDCALETLNDLAGIRVICSFQDDVYRMAEEIRDIPGLRIVKEKNYIAHPKDSGYRSIHLIVEYNGDGAFMDECCEAADIRESLRAEIQIRSVAMNYWAILDHQLCYKNEKKEAQKIKKELKACALAIAKIDKRFLKLRKRIEDL